MATQVIIQSSGPGFLVRALWYLFVGWWLTGLAIGLAYVLALTVVGLPAAFAIFNAIPALLTLRKRTTQFAAEITAGGVTVLREQKVAQRALWIRALYFVLVGFWLGAIWLTVAYALCLLIVTIPLGLMMFNRVGGVMTLLRY